MSIALLAIILGWIAIITAFTAGQRATVGNAILGLCGVIAIDFGILHWPKPKWPNQSLEPTAGRCDDRI
jgi:uncharacterized membrane protein HdeD (DUF308 family)